MKSFSPLCSTGIWTTAHVHDLLFFGSATLQESQGQVLDNLHMAFED